MNDEARAALVERVEHTINSLLYLVAIHGMKALQAPGNRGLIRKESTDIVTRVLLAADRAVPEPDADAVEAAAESAYMADIQDLRESSNMWLPWGQCPNKKRYRDMARAALAAVPTVQDAAGITGAWQEGGEGE